MYGGCVLSPHSLLVFVISGIIKFEVSVISRSRRLGLIHTDRDKITKTESNNCFIIHCFEENNDKRIIAFPRNTWANSFSRVAPGYFSL